MYSVFKVADEILRQAKEKGVSLTPMQLVKLAYINQGWYLAHTNKPLFLEPIEAWKYGPVIPALYHRTKHWGRDPIPLDKISDETSQGLDTAAKECVRVILNAYGHLTGPQLSNLTHQSGSPWHQVFKSGVRNIEISRDSMLQYYRQLVKIAA